MPNASRLLHWLHDSMFTHSHLSVDQWPTNAPSILDIHEGFGANCIPSRAQRSSHTKTPDDFLNNQINPCFLYIPVVRTNPSFVTFDQQCYSWVSLLPSLQCTLFLKTYWKWGRDAAICDFVIRDLEVPLDTSWVAEARALCWRWGWTSPMLTRCLLGREFHELIAEIQ